MVNLALTIENGVLQRGREVAMRERTFVNVVARDFPRRHVDAKLFAVLAMIGTCLLAGSACAQSAPPAEQAIRPIMAKMLAAANAFDTDAFMAPMARSPSLVFAFNGEVIHGWDALHAQQLKWWSKSKGTTKCAQDGAPGFLALGPDVEVLTWPLMSHWTSADGKTGSSDFVVTYIWQRLPQGWRIVYGHESWKKPPG